MPTNNAILHNPVHSLLEKLNQSIVSVWLDSEKQKKLDQLLISNTSNTFALAHLLPFKIENLATFQIDGLLSPLFNLDEQFDLTFAGGITTLNNTKEKFYFLGTSKNVIGGHRGKFSEGENITGRNRVLIFFPRTLTMYLGVENESQGFHIDPWTDSSIKKHQLERYGIRFIVGHNNSLKIKGFIRFGVSIEQEIGTVGFQEFMNETVKAQQWNSSDKDSLLRLMYGVEDILLAAGLLNQPSTLMLSNSQTAKNTYLASQLLALYNPNQQSILLDEEYLNNQTGGLKIHNSSNLQTSLSNNTNTKPRYLHSNSPLSEEEIIALRVMISVRYKVAEMWFRSDNDDQPFLGMTSLSNKPISPIEHRLRSYANPYAAGFDGQFGYDENEKFTNLYHFKFNFIHNNHPGKGSAQQLQDYLKEVGVLDAINVLLMKDPDLKRQWDLLMSKDAFIDASMFQENKNALDLIKNVQFENILPKFTGTLPIEFQESLNSPREKNKFLQTSHSLDSLIQLAKQEVNNVLAEKKRIIAFGNQLAKQISGVILVMPQVYNYQANNEMHNNNQPFEALLFEFNSMDNRDQLQALIHPQYIRYTGISATSGNPILLIAPEFFKTVSMDKLGSYYHQQIEQKQQSQSIASVPGTLFAKTQTNNNEPPAKEISLNNGVQHKK